uniref:Uncharacterized protein n=1 Tax=Arundo donax TaxID=35708 RepID=A0A0A9EEX2_ARUDO
MEEGGSPAAAWLPVLGLPPEWRLCLPGLRRLARGRLSPLVAKAQ